MSKAEQFDVIAKIVCSITLQSKADLIFDFFAMQRAFLAYVIIPKAQLVQSPPWATCSSCSALWIVSSVDVLPSYAESYIYCLHFSFQGFFLCGKIEHFWDF